MTGRPHLEVALRTKARLCHAYGIPWHGYGELTRREQRVLLELLEPAQAELEPAAPTSPPAPPGMTRVC